MPTLYGRTRSINVRKALWTLDEIGMTYDRVDRGGGEPDLNTPEYLALNPNALIPTWQDDEVTLWESNTICRYLARKAGRTDLMPVEPAAAGIVEQWMDWASTTLNQAWAYAFMGLVRKKPGFDDPARIEASAARWNEVMGILEVQLAATGAYVTGDSFTLADVPVGLAVHRWRTSPITRRDLPAVDAYYTRLLAREAFRPWALPDVP